MLAKTMEGIDYMDINHQGVLKAFTIIILGIVLTIGIFTAVEMGAMPIHK